MIKLINHISEKPFYHTDNNDLTSMETIYTSYQATFLYLSDIPKIHSTKKLQNLLKQTDDINKKNYNEN